MSRLPTPLPRRNPLPGCAQNTSFWLLARQIAARIEQLEGDKAKATSTSHRNKLQKEQTDLKKKQAELIIFEEKLKHAADQKISLDLDDGVKANYAKFGDLLAESKAVTGGQDDE